MGTVRDGPAGRWLAAGVAFAAILLVVPSLLSPTWEMSVSDREHGSLLSRQWEWSWGRVRVTGLEGVELRDDWNPIALGVLVVLLVAALVGVAAWASRRVGWGRGAALVTVALLTGRVLTTVADRLGRSLGEVDQGASGLTVRSQMTGAGTLETVAAVVLLVALVLMVATTGLGGRVVELGATQAPGPRSAAGAGEPPGLRPAGEHLASSPVSFDDTGKPDEIRRP
ncbi:hypothetical protein [Terrabacter sp. 2YAF2]|uniref:hypothetical protein n=1 Tax=Terrabacter sp. 2YAF2 TaxID=3233026 RepID=UPI003F9D3F44